MPTNKQLIQIAEWSGIDSPGPSTDIMKLIDKISERQRAGDARFPLCGSASGYVWRDNKLGCTCRTAQSDLLQDQDQYGSDCDPLGPGATSGSLVFALVCVLLFQTLLLVQNTQKQD